MVCGDFNEILYSFEKKSGLVREEGRMEDFRKTLEECDLSHWGLLGTGLLGKGGIYLRIIFKRG